MKKILILSLSFVLSIAIFAYQWPASTDFLSAVFGSNDGEEILDGIEFSNEGEAIYPLTDGEIIYYQSDFNFGDLNYKGYEGNILVLDHIGDFKSIYRNFISNNSFDTMDNISKNEIIGITKDIDDLDKFTFSIDDNKENLSINPQQILPFLDDSISPVINSVFIQIDDQRTELYRNMVIQPGLTKIYIDAWDVIRIDGNYKRFTPFSINVFVDGFERYNGTFSSYEQIDEILYLTGETDILLDDIYSDDGLFYGGENYFTTGSSLIEVVIKDIEGNEASRSFPVTVR